MGGIVYEPLSYHLKDALGLTPAQSAGFVATMTFPFLIKPLFGLITDLLPLSARRRAPQMIVFSSAGCAAWLTLAAVPSTSYVLLLALLILSNVALVASDVICDGVMVEQGVKTKKTGVYQAVQIGSLYATLVATGLGGGLLAANMNIRGIFALAAVFPLLSALSTFWIEDAPMTSARSEGAQGLKNLLLQKHFWCLSLFIFLWSFSPFLGTVQFYYQSDTLKLSPIFIGTLSTVGGLAGFLGAACFGKFIAAKIARARLMRWTVIFGVLLNLSYAFYLGPVSVVCVTMLTGFLGVILRLTLMDLAAQSCPSLAEATGFSIYMSVFNLAAWASNSVGGSLYEILKASIGAGTAYPAWLALVVMGTLCTAACGLLLPLVLRENV